MTTTTRPRQLKGVIVSTKMSKTVTVQVERFFKHPQYGKYISRNKKYLAHNEVAGLAVGDQVLIQETKPYSRRKTFKVIEKI